MSAISITERLVVSLQPKYDEVLQREDRDQLETETHQETWQQKVPFNVKHHQRSTLKDLKISCSSGPNIWIITGCVAFTDICLVLVSSDVSCFSTRITEVSSCISQCVCVCDNYISVPQLSVCSWLTARQSAYFSSPTYGAWWGAK